MQSVKEKAANVAASAKSGMDKTKATVQEKVERMSANHPTEKAMATEKKEEKISQAEWNKQEAREHNAAAKHAAKTTGEGYAYSTTGVPGHTTGGHQMSALPSHGIGQPAGNTVEGTVGSHQIGTATGTARPSAAHNTRAGHFPAGGFDTGSDYT